MRKYSLTVSYRLRFSTVNPQAPTSSLPRGRETQEPIRHVVPSVEAEARGWAVAMSGEFRVDESKTGRGERTRPEETYVIVAKQ